MVNQFTASLWGDEAWAATLAVKPFWQIITTVSKDTSPPLYYLLLHAWMQIFGTSEVAIRSLSFIFFLGTVLTVFFIGRHLWDKKTGLFAALLTLINPFLFTYAFEGRMYSLLALTSTLSVYFFLTKNRLGFILTTAAALYTHHFSLFVVVFEGFWMLVESLGKPFKETVQRVADFVIVGLLYIPWLYPLYFQTSLVGSGFWLGKPTSKTMIEVVGKFLVGTTKNTFSSLAWGALILIFIFRRWLKEKEKSIFLLGWFFTPLVLTFLISQVFQSIFFDRYLLMVIPAAALLLASLKRKFSLIFILIFIFSLLANDFDYFTRPTKRPFRELAGFIKQEARDLPLINYNAAAHHLWESKYYGLQAPIFAPQPLPFYTGTALMGTEDTLKKLPDWETFGVITSAPLDEVKIPNYQILKIRQFGQLSFLWMQKD